MLTDEERIRHQKESRRRYDNKTRQYVMRLRLMADADIIEKLDSVQSKTEYIRNLVRRDLYGT